MRSMTPGEEGASKMRQSQLRYLFLLLACSVGIMVIVMYAQLGHTGIREIQELLSFDRSPVESSSSVERHPHVHNHDQDIPFVLRDSDLDPYRGARARDFNISDGFRMDYSDQFAQQVESPLQLPAMERTVAIGCAITTRHQSHIHMDKIASEYPFFKGLLGSFCRTATVGYLYNFYVAHDHTDPFFSRNGSHGIFISTFYEQVTLGCPKKLNVTLHLVECKHEGHPAWAQNDAMMAAYMDNMAYYYRVNDDTVMETTGWTEKLIGHLLRYDPPNVGVVGPWFKEGNVAILTHDFVHRTHVDVFGFYYPRVFTDWFADDWITGTYYPEKCHKVPGVRVKHTMELGNRYVVHFEKAQRVHVEVEIAKLILKRWLQRKEKKEKYGLSWERESKYVIALSLYGGDLDTVYGALRYSQLVPIMFPKWRVRVYTSSSAGKSESVSAVDIIVRKLENMGIEVVRLDDSITTLYPPDMWQLMVANDTNIDRFIARASNTRPSEREASVLDDWLTVDAPLHCIRDHPTHAHAPLMSSLLGGNPKAIQSVTGKTWEEFMVGYKTSAKFLTEAVWPVFKGKCYCHDSVSCTTWEGAHPFPLLRAEDEFIGERYDANDQQLDKEDTLRWNTTYIRPECVSINNTGFDDDAVRAVIQHRPLFWSQDYHVTPIMDFKSLLTPIGVKFVDNSLSYYCGNVGTCGNLKVINKENGMRLTPELVEQFYQAYKNDDTMKRVTAFICTLPVAMCEAFTKFNKSMIIISTIRYEQARPEPAKWNKLNELLLNVSKDPKSLVAANNLYDSKYIEYFTGIKPPVIPNACNYLSDVYKPSRKQFLLVPIHSTELYDEFLKQFDTIAINKRLDLAIYPLRQMYPQYLFADLAAHPGIIYVPYQVSMSSFTEQYRMGIPIFCPTLRLLAKWHVQYQVVRQRTWNGYMWRKSDHSYINGTTNKIPDPNNDVDEEAVAYWLQFSDFYQWPHIIYFESVEDLVKKLQTVDLQEMSKRMMEFNKKTIGNIKSSWSKILKKVTTGESVELVT